MKLTEIVKNTSCKKIFGNDVEIKFITDDSRQIKHGGCFVAVKGHSFDGHRYIESAIKNGASAIILNDESYLPQNIAACLVDDTKKEVGKIASAFYGYPSCDMTVCGITGTNGKTSSTYLLESIFKTAGFNVGVIGTVNYRYMGKDLPAPNTTPGAIEMQKLLADMRQSGVTHVLMEVSSHALDQYRADGTRFGFAQFTNLTRDHLDYHDDMQSYLKAKQRLFDPLLKQSAVDNKAAIINLDDEYAEQVLGSFDGKVIRTSLKNSEADIFAEKFTTSLDGNTISLRIFEDVYEFQTSLTGVHNIKNIIQTVAMAYAADVAVEHIINGVAALKAIPGRVERVEDTRRRHVFVDYSHTPDALENALNGLKELKKNRLFVVFGCGGDRDRGKRPLMGKVAATLADVAIVTSDNPRCEDPNIILSEIEPGVIAGKMQKAESLDPLNIQNNEYVVIESRAMAIAFACKAARAEDVILIAGKGHEDYQIIGTTKHHFDDREEAAKALSDCGDH